MNRLLERIEGKQPGCRADGGQGVRPSLVGQELRERLQRQVPEPLSLRQEPLLEQGLIDRQPGEEVAGVGRGRRLERVRRALGDEPLEEHRVDLHPAGVEPHGVAFHQQERRLDARERLPQVEEDLTHRMARLAGAELAPQERGELVARLGLTGVEGEIGQQGLGLASRKSQGRRPAVEPCLETAEQPEPEVRHPSFGSDPHHSAPSRQGQ